MNIYGKLTNARNEFHALSLKKTGHNKYAGYQYFELADFLVPGLDVMKNHGLCPVISFGDDCATMTIYEVEGEGSITITSPMRDAPLKGTHPIQQLGAVETYQRRYLWMAALEIVEHDAVDSAEPAAQPEPTVTAEQAEQIRTALRDVEGDEAAFCKWLKVRKIEDLYARNFKTAMDAISRKAAA